VSGSAWKPRDVRRRLIWTVAATTTMVLIALLVPMGALLQQYATEDRLARAALEVQAIETVVSGQDRGAVSVYLDARNTRDPSITTTVYYPGEDPVGPGPSEDALIEDTRGSGRARVDDIGGGIQVLVPVALGGTSGLPEQTPVVRMVVHDSGARGDVLRAWAILGSLGLLILAGAVALADRLARSFVVPITALADAAGRIGRDETTEPVAVTGPPEIRSAALALNRLSRRIDGLLEHERRSTADLSHRLRTPITALRLGIDGLDSPTERDRLDADVDRLEAMVDHLVHEAGRAGRQGLAPRCDAAQVVRERGTFWSALAEDQGRALHTLAPADPVWVAVPEDDLSAAIDILFDNVFSHTPEAAPLCISLTPGDPVRLTVEDGGPGLSDELDVARRGISGIGSSGLGLAIASRTAHDSGGGLELGCSPDLGGARVVLLLGAAEAPPAT